MYRIRKFEDTPIYRVYDYCAVDTLIINAGERYDFVLTTDQSVDNYWMRFRGLGNCDSTSGEAILRYNGAPESDPSGTVTHDEANRAGVVNDRNLYISDIFLIHVIKRTLFLPNMYALAAPEPDSRSHNGLSKSYSGPAYGAQQHRDVGFGRHFRNSRPRSLRTVQFYHVQ